MKIKKRFLLFLLLAALCFVTCDNPIISKWWADDAVQPGLALGPEPEYIPIIRDIPYEKIVEVIVDGGGTLSTIQNLKIIAIEYIIFSGDQHLYNQDAAQGASSNLNAQERSTNDKTINAMAQSLKANPSYLIMLHGHANPANFDKEELKECEDISKSRACEVAKVLWHRFKDIGGNPDAPPEWGGPKDGVKTDYNIETWCNDVWFSATWDGRMSKPKGYSHDNTHTLYPPNSTYAGLNRRVEMILFEITQ